MSLDPLQTVWDALAAAGCQPHGERYDFRSRCPAHDGENRESLHVSIGADGAAVLWCFAHECAAEEITAAIGISLRDLYPPGHRRGDSQPVHRLKRSDFHGVALQVANVLYALEKLGEPWQLMISCDCPACSSQGAWMRANSAGYITADCLEECDSRRYVQALLARCQEKDAQR